MGVTAINAVGSGGMATAPAQDATGVSMQGYEVLDSGGLDMSVDPTTDTIALDSTVNGSDTTYDQSGNVISSVAVTPDTAALWTGLTPDATAKPTCYKKTVQNANVIALKTFYNAHQGNSYTQSWLNQIYEVKNARVKQDNNGNSYQTRQYQFCVTGGGNVSNSYHQWFDAHASLINQTGSKWINKIWGRGPAPGNKTISTVLNFVLSQGKATTGADVTVNPGHGDYDGTIGRDTRFTGFPAGWKDFWKNRINTFYVSPHTFPWDGTGSYEGNTSQITYEFHMSYAGKVHFLSDWQISAFCTKPWPVHCAPFPRRQF